MKFSSSNQIGHNILIVDDHAAILSGTVGPLQSVYPKAKIQTAATTHDALGLLERNLFDVAILDLAVPEQINEVPTLEIGIDLLRHIFQNFQSLNIVVQSAKVEALTRVKPSIDRHLGGFTVIDKNLPIEEMLTKVAWALKGVVYTPPEIRNGLEMRIEWIQVLQLAFQEALTDKAIAERLHVSERGVRHYWTKAQDALGVYPSPGINIRMQTAIRARQVGLID
ncbi:response regulator transcription factor [Leptothoe sp. PORK10 BA2]|uniref:response regulator transcription factor n=1 Tax=Leptothoe sp. PORK10 BA2 TaxID=3110254 RepID=UPI002B20C118|nr:response regulator transcription factor [Leptothoe sp. PORK10 BA2]MEA5467157.1 response regulator transcription factor [Leptothoe sp. PORK10 BA2]